VANFTAGTSFTDGVTNDVTAAKLNALVADAVPTSSLALASTTGTIGLFSSGTGTAATPAIQPTGDANTGIFFPAADTIAFAEGGAEAVRINSSGQVGIGTTSPAHLLEANSGSANTTVVAAMGGTINGNFKSADYLNTASARWTFGRDNISTGDFVFKENTEERMRIATTTGNVGVGTASPSAKLDVSGSLGIRVNEDGAGTKVITVRSNYSSIGPAINVTTNDPLLFLTNNTERLRIDSSGNLLVGTTSGGLHRIVKSSASDFALQVSNTSSSTPYVQVLTLGSAAPNDATSMFLRCDDTGLTGRIQLRSNGGLANFSANNVNLSDERLKESIQPSPSYLDKICSIPVVNYKYKDQTHNDYNLGVIAQQVEAVCPELVDVDGFGETPEDGVPLKSIYQTDLQYALMKCIQELKSENDTLKSRIEALEAA
jgi:hypothetical protein